MINVDQFLNSKYAINYRILSVFWYFRLAFFMLQYAMNVKWKTIGNEQNWQSQIKKHILYRFKFVLTSLKKTNSDSKKCI